MPLLPQRQDFPYFRRRRNRPGSSSFSHPAFDYSADNSEEYDLGSKAGFIIGEDDMGENTGSQRPRFDDGSHRSRYGDEPSHSPFHEIPSHFRFDEGPRRSSYRNEPSHSRFDEGPGRSPFDDGPMNNRREYRDPAPDVPDRSFPPSEFDNPRAGGKYGRKPASDRSSDRRDRGYSNSNSDYRPPRSGISPPSFENPRDTRGFQNSPANAVRASRDIRLDRPGDYIRSSDYSHGQFDDEDPDDGFKARPRRARKEHDDQSSHEPETRAGPRYQREAVGRGSTRIRPDSERGHGDDDRGARHETRHGTRPRPMESFSEEEESTEYRKSRPSDRNRDGGRGAPHPRRRILGSDSDEAPTHDRARRDRNQRRDAEPARRRIPDSNLNDAPPHRQSRGDDDRRRDTKPARRRIPDSDSEDFKDSRTRPDPYRNRRESNHGRRRISDSDFEPVHSDSTRRQRAARARSDSDSNSDDSFQDLRRAYARKQTDRRLRR